MKIKLYPKELLEAAWKQDKKLYAHGDAAAPPKCLRCGSPLAAHLMVNALSRYADVQICEACGMDEALRDAAHTPLPLAEWDAVKSGHLKKSAEKSTCYLVQNCTFSEVFKHTYKPPMQLIEKTPPELVKEIDEFQNALFKLPAFKTLETMKRFCRYAGTTSDPTEFNLYSETAHLYIRIRLITRFRDYNAYIYYYDKAAAGEEQ